MLCIVVGGMCEERSDELNVSDRQYAVRFAPALTWTNILGKLQVDHQHPGVELVRRQRPRIVQVEGLEYLDHLVTDRLPTRQEVRPLKGNLVVGAGGGK